MRDWREKGDCPTLPNEGQWRAWMSANGHGKTGQPAAPTPPVTNAEPPREHSPRHRLQIAQAEKIETENLVRKGQLLDKSEVIFGIGETFLAITAALRRFPEVVAPLVFGLPDIYEVMRVLREEADSLLNGLGRARYLEPEFIRAALIAVDLPPESEHVVATAFNAIGEAIRIDLSQQHTALRGLPPSEKDSFEISDEDDKTPEPIDPLLTSQHMAPRAPQKDAPRPARPPAGKPVRKRKPRPTPAVSPDRAGAAAAAAPVAKRRTR